MARFILDIANLNESEIKEIMNLITKNYFANKIVSIYCIDRTNENQFYEDTFKNNLSKKQIKNYKLLITS